MRASKKTESIEVRLPDDTKRAFADHCRRDGRTVSEAIRRYIEGELAPMPPRHAKPPGWRVAIAALAGAALGFGAAAPSLARSADLAPSICAHPDHIVRR